MCRLLRLLLIRFPNRTFVFAGDSGYGTHEVARFCYRHRSRLTRVSKLHPDANLFDPPPPYAAAGRPRLKGQRRLKPRPAAGAAEALARLEVGWYGGGKRRVETLDGTGHWYKGGCGLVPLRWVFVKDATGTHRDEYFFTTDPSLTPAAVIGHYCGRTGRSRSTRQTAPQGGGGPVPVGSVTIDVTALLELAAWCRQRREDAPGGAACPTPPDAPRPPRLTPTAAPASDPPPVWAHLPADRRKQLHDLLGQPLARRHAARARGEAGHD